jgi:hypothetical protein
MPGRSGLAAIREGVENLPVAFLDEQAHEIGVLCDYRVQLMHERNRLINRLRWHLVRIAPEIEAQLGPAALKGRGSVLGSRVNSGSCRPVRSCESPRRNCDRSTRSRRSSASCSQSSPS